MEKYPDRYQAGQLRTLQRRVRRWRAESGPDREVVFAQKHRPGEAAQTDFTSTTELAVTIAGQSFRASAVRDGAAVLELAVGDGVPVGVDGGDSDVACSERCSSSGRVPSLPSDGQLDGGDTPDS